MQRVAIIGSGGAGKSTFARRLAAVTGLPLVHLDREFWRPGWTPTPDEEWGPKVEAIVGAERWITDGNYGGTMAMRIAAADTVIWMDYPRLRCTWRAFKRGALQRGRGRPDMAPRCPERVDPGFLWWVWTYRDRRRPAVRRLLTEHAAGRRVLVLRNDRQADRFLALAATARGGGDGIRPATLADAGAIAAIHTGGWHAAYRHIFDDDTFRRRSVDVRLAEYRELLADMPREERLWVAEREGRIAGFAYIRPGLDTDIERGGELKLLYVRPSERGGGIGLSLFDYAVADLRARGYAPYLYTLRENAAARRWYEQRGWRHDGATQPWSTDGKLPLIEECRYRPV